MTISRDMLAEALDWAAHDAKSFWLVAYVYYGRCKVLKLRYTKEGAHRMAQTFRRYPHAYVNSVIKVTLK